MAFVPPILSFTAATRPISRTPIYSQADALLPLRRKCTMPTTIASRKRVVAMTAATPDTPTAKFSAAVGTSTAKSTVAAVDEAVESALSSLNGAPTAAIVVCTVDRVVLEVQNALHQALPNVHVHGATTCAAALTNDGAADEAISILLVHAPGQVACAACATPEDVPADRAARMALSHVSHHLGGEVGQLLLFSSPGSEEQVLRALHDEMPDVPVFGGSSADNTVAGLWRVFSGQQSFNEGLSLMGLHKDVKFGAALVPPYEASDVSAVVTSAEGRCIHQLDGRPAAEVLHEWIGGSIDQQVRDGGNIIVESALCPLGIERADGKFIGIQAAEIVDNGAVGLFAEVATGDRLVVMKWLDGADAPTAIGIALDRAYESAIAQGGLSRPKAGLLIYCGGLSIAVGDELDKSLQGMKKKVPVLGMTAFGEQGPLNGQNVHSNLTVGIALFE